MSLLSRLIKETQFAVFAYSIYAYDLYIKQELMYNSNAKI